MKKSWSKDPKEILDMLTNFTETGLPVSVQLNSNWVLRTKLLKIHYYREWPYLLLLRPAGLESSSHIDSILLKMNGFPILGFSPLIERESANVLAIRLPDTIFQLELRQNSRIAPLQGSMATFFIKDRARVSICTMENISMGGVKLVGRPTHHIKNGDVIGPCTLSLAGRDALISREVTVDNAVVVRVADEDGHSSQTGLGLEFDLSKMEKRQLKEHIDYIANM
jgi:hypothetical protein